MSAALKSFPSLPYYCLLNVQMFFSAINAVAGVPLKQRKTQVKGFGLLLHSLEPSSTKLDAESGCKHSGGVEMALNMVVLLNSGHHFLILGACIVKLLF